MENTNVAALGQLTDEQLVHLARQGEGRAFDVLLGRYRTYLYKYLLRLNADSDAAEDIIQDAYFKVFKSIHQFRGEAGFKSWLFAIVRNTWKNYLRSRQYLNRMDHAQDIYDLSLASEESVEITMIRKQQSAQLRKAIKALPNKQRTTLSMRINEQLPFRKIAEVMQCSISTAKANHYFGAKSVEQMLVAA